MSLLPPAARRTAARLLLLAPPLLAAGTALARGGGGHSYSGGSPDGGGDSGGDGSGLVLLLLELLFRHPRVGLPLLVVGVVVFLWLKRKGALGPGFTTGQAGALGRPASYHLGGGAYDLGALQASDPDFSEPLFLDFVSSLAARSVATLGTPQAAPLAPYLAGPRALLAFGAGGWRNVVVGSARVRSIAVPADFTRVAVEVALGASGPAGGRWWRTTWSFVRKAGVRSKGPGEITRLACPACGAGSERREDGACRYCGQRPAPGDAAWAVATVAVSAEESRPPIALGGYAEERGTDWPTVFSPTVGADLQALPQRLPGLDWEATRQRFTRVFLALQKAWSERDLAAIRPLTTDALFSTWRYWVEAYRAAGLRNLVEQVQVTRLEPARVSLDRYYAAVTVRIHASMLDRTLDDGGRVVGGQAAPRAFSEYWTFVRTLATARPEGVTCPGCGATLPAGQTGQCPYCQSLVAAPTFEWILSRIDQDEDYTGT